MTMNVVLRYVFGFSFNWGDEILRYMCVYMAFLGTAAGWRYGTHIGVTIFVEKLFPEKTRKYFRLLADIISITFMALIAHYGYILVEKVARSHQASAALRVPMYMIYSIIPVCAVFSILQILLQIFKHKTYLMPRE
ncbi:TRAP transporter small permease [Oscillospiraceae bacterium MB24-C1]|nr:TRAP transporter small permease [Oscillospiraceae bacterium MB24-C1]